MATAPNQPVGDPFVGTPSLQHPAPLRYASFDNEQLHSSYSTNSPAQAKRALEAHLKDTDRRINDASKLGTTLLQQRKDLSNRLKEVEELDKENQVPAELQTRLAELEKEYNEVGRETARAFLPKPKAAGSEAAPQAVFETQARSSPSKVAAPTRRQRNQPTNRVHDIEFATEIGTQLLAQVRQLQSALAEKDDMLQHVTVGKTQLENDHSNLGLRMKALGDELQRHKDENWNLETKIQDLETGLRESSDKEHKLGQAVKTLSVERRAAEQQLEDLRSLHEKTAEEHKSTIRQHEGDLHLLRREAANHDTEKQRLQKKVDELTSQNTELAKAVSYRWNAANQAPGLTNLADRDSDSFDDVDMEPTEPGSPVKGTPARAGMLESETLKSSLNHAHRMIQNLKNNIHREKTEKVELRRMLNDARDELERKRDSGTSAQVANMSRKRKSDDPKFKKPAARASALGASRSSTTEILEDEPDWEDHEGSRTPSKSTFAAAGAGSTRMPGAFRQSDSETTDAFETADEARTATETEAFQTGAESFGEDSDELTETEGGPKRVVSSRANPSFITSSPGTMAGTRTAANNRNSYISTASASNSDASDDGYDGGAVSTPIAHKGDKYRLRMSRNVPGSRKGSARQGRDDIRSSPAPSSDRGTPVPVGLSLGDELEGLEEDSMGDSARSSMFFDDDEAVPSSPPTQLQDVAISSGDVGEQHRADETVLAQAAVPKKAEMKDAGVMTEPWEPETKPAPAFVPENETEAGTLRKRAGDVLGGALAGVGLGALVNGKHDDHEQQSEKHVNATSGEPTALRESDTMDGHPRTNGVNAEPAHVPVREEKVLSPTALPHPAPAPSYEHITATHSGSKQLPTPVEIKRQGVHLRRSAIVTLETEPVSSERPASKTQHLETPPVAVSAAGIGALAGHGLAEHQADHKQPFSFSPVVAQTIEPVRSTDTGSLAAGPLEKNVIPGTAKADYKQSFGFSPVVAQTIEPVRSTDTGSLAAGPLEKNGILGTATATPGAGFIAASSGNETADSNLNEPKVYGGGKGSSAVSGLIVADADAVATGERVSPSPKSGTSVTPLQERSVNVEPGRESTRPRTAIAVSKTMVDGGSQTTISGEEIDLMLRDKSKVLPTAAAVATFGAVGGAAAAHTMANSPSRSVESPGASDLSFFPRSGLRKPASSSSMRGKGFTTQPPLPADHTRKILTAAHTTGSTPATPGQMLPPAMSASAYRHNSRPKTPADAYGPATVRTPSRDGTTPRAQRPVAPISRHTSVSSFASELDERFNIHRGKIAYPEDLPATTDPRMIQAITQTMIGEYLWKYTRKAGRSGTQSSTRHRRFFWVHPYTRTLYWSEFDPAKGGAGVMKAKSLAIESVRVVSDDNPSPPGLHRKSIVVVTPGREIVFTAPTGQRHETWFNALSYLLLRTGSERKDDAQTATTEEDLAEFNPPVENSEPHGFSIKRSLSRLTNRQSFSSYNSRATAHTASPSKDRAYPPPVRQSAAATTTPTLIPTAHEAARPRSSQAAQAAQGSNRFASITSRFSTVRGRESFGSSRRGAQSSLSQRSGQGDGIYNASLVAGGEGQSAEDLRRMIERQETGARVENVRSCCDGKHDVGSLSRRGKGGRLGSSHGRLGSSHGHHHHHAR